MKAVFISLADSKIKKLIIKNSVVVNSFYV